MEERKLARWLSRYDGPPLTLMEVCGTHTSALYRSGIRQMLPHRSPSSPDRAVRCV